MVARHSSLPALLALAAALWGTPSIAKQVSTSRAFGKATYGETIDATDSLYRFVGIPDRSIALSVSLTGIAFTDRGQSFTVEISTAQCRAVTSLDGYQDVETEEALSSVIDTSVSELLKSCGLGTSSRTSERSRLKADRDDLLTAILFMKSRAAALFGSLLRCEQRPDRSPIMILDGQRLPSCSVTGPRNRTRTPRPIPKDRR